MFNFVTELFQTDFFVEIQLHWPTLSSTFALFPCKTSNRCAHDLGAAFRVPCLSIQCSTLYYTRALTLKHLNCTRVQPLRLSFETAEKEWNSFFPCCQTAVVCVWGELKGITFHSFLNFFLHGQLWWILCKGISHNTDSS